MKIQPIQHKKKYEVRRIGYWTADQFVKIQKVKIIITIIIMVIVLLHSYITQTPFLK